MECPYILLISGGSPPHRYAPMVSGRAERWPAVLRRLSLKRYSNNGRTIDLAENSDFCIAPQKYGADIPITPEEEFVNGVYASVDEAVRSELSRLRSDDGVIPTCRLGCCHCCGQHILTNIAEANCLAQYIKREFSVDQIYELRMRTQQWHEWDDIRVGRYPSTHTGQKTALSDDDNRYCPLLVEGACSAYPMRPVICRTHFVCSDHSYCRQSNDPESIKVDPLALTTVVTAASPFSAVLRDRIENAGLDFNQSIMLLPHWLANAMGWDFAISL